MKIRLGTLKHLIKEAVGDPGDMFAVKDGTSDNYLSADVTNMDEFMSGASEYPMLAASGGSVWTRHAFNVHWFTREEAEALVKYFRRFYNRKTSVVSEESISKAEEAY